MKRHNNLWTLVTGFENLFLAARKAQRGKRWRGNVLQFNHQLEGELIQLQQELQTKTYRPGAYRTFQLLEPKRRLISAAPYRDRVVHHAVCNVIVPILEQGFIRNSYANRVGFGTHQGLARFVSYARTYPYVMQCDIKKYFASIDREILKTLLRDKLKCEDTLWLLNTIIDASNPQEPIYDYFPGDNLFTPHERSRGIPLGNLTSQFFANLYLDKFDHFVTQELRIGKYLRYMDDFAMFSLDQKVLVAAKPMIEDHLAELRLKLHPSKTQLQETRQGMTFLGFRILPLGETFPKGIQMRVRNDNLRQGRKRVRNMKEAYFQGTMTMLEVEQSIQSWFAHLAHADTWHLRQQILAELDWLVPK